jgi:hypothetical protein
MGLAIQKRDPEGGMVGDGIPKLAQESASLLLIDIIIIYSIIILLIHNKAVYDFKSIWFSNRYVSVVLWKKFRSFGLTDSIPPIRFRSITLYHHLIFSCFPRSYPRKQPRCGAKI